MLPFTSVITYIKNQNENPLIYLFDDNYLNYLFYLENESKEISITQMIREGRFTEKMEAAWCVGKSRGFGAGQSSVQIPTNFVVNSKLFSLSLFIFKV